MVGRAGLRRLGSVGRGSGAPGLRNALPRTEPRSCSTLARHGAPGNG